MLQVTDTYYRQKVSDVLNYIHNHLADDLNLKLLAEQFGFSFFHFHRITKAYLNESLGSYINRVRLDTAINFIRNSDLPLSDIALLIGYSDCSAFSKAFSKKFGFSPQKFKSNNAIVLNTHVDYTINSFGILVADIRPKIVILDDKPILYAKFKGDFTQSEFNKTWSIFWKIAMQDKLLNWKPDVFSVYYDSPFETAAADCRAECCIATNKKSFNSEFVQTKTLNGGKFAVFRYKGPHTRLLEVNENILKKWIINSTLNFRDSPLIEKYTNNYRYTEPNSLLTEIYVPINDHLTIHRF